MKFLNAFEVYWNGNDLRREFRWMLVVKGKNTCRCLLKREIKQEIRIENTKSILSEKRTNFCVYLSILENKEGCKSYFLEN